MGDVDGMTHDEMLHDYAAAEMDDVVDSDRHDSDVDGVSAVLFDSSNNI